jgi:hypothetical protein
MSQRYNRQIEMAQRLVKKYGQACTLKKQAETVNETQPWKTAAGEPVEHDCIILFLRPSGGMSRALYHLIQRTDVTSGAPRGLMAVQNGFVPDLTDSVIRNGSTMVIKTIDEVNPGGDVILYDIEFA